ncbi:unnamed protein product [Arabis nemorensis]|uniref:Uncharacterized protein n=1 Tax=Arabis nemorensis TaxID=586526 RepID=A0A565BAI0_9BRAS|nr:unnamed protein product [Arabis nemorensis]
MSIFVRRAMGSIQSARIPSQAAPLFLSAVEITSCMSPPRRLRKCNCKEEEEPPVLASIIGWGVFFYCGYKLFRGDKEEEVSLWNWSSVFAFMFQSIKLDSSHILFTLSLFGYCVQIRAHAFRVFFPCPISPKSQTLVAVPLTTS